MAPTSAPRSSRSATLLGSLLVGAMALLAAPAGAATTVVTCTPSAGTNPTLKVSPAAVPPPGVGKYGFKLKTTIDGCVANTPKLADWVPNKNGTPDGASIAQAEVSLSLAGYGNCAFGLDALSPAPPSAYDPVGTMKIKWLDANGDTIKSVKPSVAVIRMTPVTSAGFATFGSLGAGTVDKGLGVGGTARVAWPLSLPSNFDLTDPWTACLVGGFTPPPGFPPLPEPVPLKTLQLAGRPSIEIRLLDLE